MKSFGAYKKADPGDNGLNNASILTFSRDVVDALIKELTQNSIDAKEEKREKVRVKVNLVEIETSEIEGIESLNYILTRMSEYWTNKNQSDFVKFFNNGSEIINNGKLHVFSFEDFNTKGLEGDETSGSFKNLVYDEGVSDNKPNNALGGFGIGKNSFFALTALQTVFYSSFNSNSGHIFFGVTKLAEYFDSKGVRRNNRVYYGDWDNDYVKHITDINEIPEKFRRHENGLSSFAIGVVFDKDWKSLVIKALIKNYWFLFENDKIEAEVDGELINKTNYFDKASEVFTEADSILSFIQTFKNPEYTSNYNIHEIGNIKILLSEEPANSLFEYPDKIVFIRDGMMIKEYTLGVRNLPNRVAGIIYCENTNGNKILSMMEPPAHNDFESYYLPKKHSKLTEEDGKKIIKQIEESRRKAVLALKETYNQPTKQVEFIDELLAGLSVSTGAGNYVGNNNASVEETFNISKKEGEVMINLSSLTSNIVSTNNEGEGEGEGGGRKTKLGARSGSGISNGNGTGEGEGGKGTKNKRSKSRETINSAKFYFSHEENGFNHYLLIIYVDNALDNVSLRFTQHGDSPTKALSTELCEVSNDTEKFNVIKDSSYFEITGLKLKPNLKNKFYLKFKENFKSAFKILK